MTLLFAIACALVLCLTAGDRVAFRWATVLSCMFAAQFVPTPLAGPAQGAIVEAFGMGVMLVITNRQAHYAGAVFVLSVFAQLANLAYFAASSAYIDISAPYWWSLQVFFAAQLLIVGRAGMMATLHQGVLFLRVVADWLLPRRGAFA